MSRLRLGDCSITGCLRDAFTKATLTDKTTGDQATGLVCDEHAKEIDDATG
jgi:hypothetical protein